MSLATFIFVVLLIVCANAFVPQHYSTRSIRVRTNSDNNNTRFTASVLLRHMSEEPTPEDTVSSSSSSGGKTTVENEDEEEAPVDMATRLMMEKQRRADELRAQEVFMKKSTGRHRCTNCEWEYDEKKGDSNMIGGRNPPGTPFAELPSNWRCPRCRASKDSFQEVVEEISGFAVNQGYGFGGNSMTSGQKSGLIFGSLFLFFILFLSGYALS